MKVFLISPVRGIDEATRLKIEAHVQKLEKQGHEVHFPLRDTKQDDPTGGYEICRANFRAMINAQEVHVWYDETSNGSKFDMGGVFMLVEMLDWQKRVVIVNDNEVTDNLEKSFYKVLRRLAEGTKI